MADTTSNLGLTVWNNLSDPYDSSQLVDNFVKIDAHDHSGGGKGPTIKTAAIENGAITTAKIASGGITPASVTGTAVITTDSRLSDGRPPDYLDVNWSTDADYTIAATKSSIVRQTATLTGAKTATLPAANALAAGTEIIVQAGGSVDATKTVTIQRAGSDLINGASTSVVIGVPYGFRRFVTDGISSWVYDAGVLRASNNLSELTATASTARQNLGISTAGGDLTGTYPNPTLAAVGTAGTYDKVTVDAKGRVTVGANIGYGSTLPSSPSDGDEYYYKTNGSVWHLRYTTNSALNKWQFVGGSALIVTENSTSTLTSTTYVYDITTADGPSITIPTNMTGTYKVEFGMDVSNTNAGKVNYMGLFTSSTANTNPLTNSLGSNIELIVANADNNGGANPATYTASKIVHNVNLTATNTIYAQFKTSANTATVLNRYISITPITLG